MAAANYDNSHQDYAFGGGILSLTGATGWAIGGSNRYLVISVFNGNSANISANAAKWQGSAGASLSRIGSSVPVGLYWNHDLFDLIAPAAVTDVAYVSWAGAVDEALMQCISFKDVDQVAPRGTVATGTGITGAASINVSAVVGELIADFLVHGDQFGSPTPSLTVGSNQTARQTVQGLAPTGGYEQMGCSTSIAAGSTEVMDWTIAGNVDPVVWSMFGFQVNGISAGASTFPPVPAPPNPYLSLLAQ
jgi:hypothetical protein